MNEDTLKWIKHFDDKFLAGSPEGIHFSCPKNYNRLNVLQEGDKCYEGFCLGIVFSWNGGHGWRTSCISKGKKYKPLLENGMKLINSYDPKFECTTIQFNKNYKVKKHIDGNNVGESYIIGLGNYSGGELIVYNEQDQPTYIDINHKFYKFNGSKYYHETADFIGERMTLVFFKLGGINKSLKKTV
tara:strand:- start:339 stop:896 length:558 start_codon:yes stop_codon:yes gene_type:complete